MGDEYVTALSPQEIERIGHKVFLNECAGKDECLVQWNEGEEFMSLGIGHFIWYPQGEKGPFEESFPAFVKHLRENSINIPAWLDSEPFPSCPWASREDFLKERQGQKAQELYQFLIDTKSAQAAFLMKRLESALPLILNTLPQEQRTHIEAQFNRVASSAQGMYVLVDYINFKGLGIYPSERYQERGWGLMHVLSEMKGEKNAIEEFVESAKNHLTWRVDNAPLHRQEQKWLPGWKKRINTYLERGEYE